MTTITGPAAVAAARELAEKWLQEEGMIAFAAIEEAREKADKSARKLPSWVMHPDQDWEKSSEIASRLIDAVAQGDDGQAAGWAKRAIKNASSPAMQAVDPVTLGIVGVILVVSILAARVRKIGAVEFYKGVPKELADVMKSVPRVSSE